MKTLITFLSISLISFSAFAASGSGNHSLEFGVGIATASQDDINSWATANSGQQMSSGTEFSFSYSYRWSSSMFALVFRPSYFTQQNTGTASASLNATTFMPMVRLYPLENNFIRFFLQIGMGGTWTTGRIAVGAGSASFAGGAFGSQAGLGADFCFTSTHCMTVEGNFRYMPIPRSVITASSGALGAGGMTATNELEKNSVDAQNSLTGILGLIQYTIKF